jgi:hypothetical protein
VVFIKKMSIIFLTISIFFSSLILPVKNAYAFTATDINKATKIIRGIGEKIGIKWTAPSLYAAVGYILADKSPEGLSFVGNIPIMDGQIKPDGYQQYLLSPDDWKNGTKLIVKASGDLVPDAVVPIYGQCVKPPVDSTGNSIAYENSGSKWLSIDNGTEIWIFTVTSGDIKLVGSSNVTVGLYPLDGGYKKISYIYKSTGAVVPYANTPSLGATEVGVLQPGYTFLGASNNIYGNGGSLLYSLPGIGDCNYKVDTNNVVNVSTINNTIINNIDNSTTYIMPIDVPVTDDPGDVTVPWNPPLTPEETDDIYPPLPVDTDNDGIPDDTDITPGGETPTPDDTGIFAKLFPVLLIVKLFGVLGSCLMYLVRMFQFIMTIPGIDAIPIDNDAFVWFRSAQIVGIKIYDVVSSLAGVGLSFIVFRAIRRAYL